MYVGAVGAGRCRVKRFAIWVGALALAVAAGFGLGALTYVPPSPDMNAEPSGTVTSPEPATATHSAPEVIPDVVGLQRAAAEKKLDDLNVLFLVDPVSGKADDFVHLEAGTALKISRGPFAGYEAIFDTKLPGTDRIRILLSLVRGAQIPLDLPVTYVEKKD